MSGAGMVWDLRTGKGIYEVQESSSILCCDFSPSGHELAISGKSNLITIKDLRQRSTLKQIPAHVKLVSDVKYHQSGKALASCSHDNSVKIWHGLHYGLINNDIQLTGKVSSVDFHEELLAATTIDRKFTIWARKSAKIKKEIVDHAEGANDE